MLYALFTSIPVVVCGLMTLQLYLTQRRCCQQARWWLFIFGCAATLLYACHLVYFHRQYALLPFTDVVYMGCNLLVFPLFLVYISNLTETIPLSERCWPMTIIIGVPVLAMLCGCVFYALMDRGDELRFLKTFLYGFNKGDLQGVLLMQAWLHKLCRVAFLVEVVLVAWLGTKKIQSFNHLVSTLYADTENYAIYRIGCLFRLMILAIGVSVVCNFLGRDVFADTLWLAVPAVVFSAIIFSICFLGMQRQFTRADMERELAYEDSLEHVIPAGKNSQQDNHDKTLLRESFERLMDEECLFLLPDLKVRDVAIRLGTNRTYLFDMLTNDIGMTFSEYINRRRVAYAQDLMNADPSLTKVRVAERAGYTTPSSFYRNLRKYGK